MTAACTEPDENGLTQCHCPTIEGPYQIGQSGWPDDGPYCPEAGERIWSAAYGEIGEDLLADEE